MSGNIKDYALDHELQIDNQFYVDGNDFSGFTFPEPQVKGWSTLIGNSTGSVTVEAEFLFPGRDYATRFTLARTEFSDYAQKPGIMKHYNKLVKEWNKDNRGNWLRILRENIESVASYHEKQLRTSQQKLDVATANLDWLSSVEG